MTDRDQALSLYGTEEPVPTVQRFEAGALSCEFEGGQVRGVWWGEVELLRGVAYLLRDRHWGTAPAVLEDLQVVSSPDRFELRFGLRMALQAATLQARARIEGSADGRFRFEVDAQPDSALESCRCGFVVLHPADCAGAALEVEHTDGRRELTGFPRTISPGQPVFDIRALHWSPRPGLKAQCRLAAALPGRPEAGFEMEDQRNWSDASFKTYVGSLLDPWPYVVPAGLTLRQSVGLQVDEAGTPARGATATRPRTPAAPLRWAAITGMRMPPLGLGVPHLDRPPDAHERAAVLALRPAWLVVQADPGRPDLAAQLALARRLAEDSGAAVQLDALAEDTLLPTDSATALARACRDAGLAPAAVRLCPRAYLKSYQPSDRWPELAPLEQFAVAARAAFPGARIGGGMLTYFTELNRKRQGTEGLDFIGHNVCPIVHAADEASVMQTLESLAHMAHTVCKVWPGLGWRVGPVTLGSAFNPYGLEPVANPHGHRVPLAATDPRHQGRVGAAWYAALVATMAPLGVELLSLLGSHGAGGPLLAPTQPGWRPGATVPAWAVLRELAAWAGAPLRECAGLPAGVVALAVAGEAGADGGPGVRALLVNTSARAVALTLHHPMQQRTGAEAPARRDDRLHLEPYALAFLDDPDA